MVCFLESLVESDLLKLDLMLRLIGRNTTIQKANKGNSEKNDASHLVNS